MNISELRDLKLTQDEWYTLDAIRQGNYPHCEKARHDPRAYPPLDMLVLSGLITRHSEGAPILTADGAEAAIEADMTFNWEEFAYNPTKTVEDDDTVFLNGEPIARSDALAEALASPKRMTVGSLVRHTTTGGVGLITHHTMWDADWGAFRVQFNKPVDNVIEGRVLNQSSHITDRADKFELVY